MVFNVQDIGFVRRVDFCPIDKKPGFVENTDSPVKSAFIHFHCFNARTQISADIQAALARGESYRLNVNGLNLTNGYWILLKAKNPVQDTMMNNHQIVDNCRYLEKLIENKDKQIEKITNNCIGLVDVMNKQHDKIANLELKINSMSTIIRHFIGGLYCHKSQQGCLEYNYQLLDSNGYDQETLPRDTHEWGNWPTTRQGDSNEKRIERIEEKLNMAFIKEDDDDDIMMEDEHEMLLKTPGSSKLTRLDSNM
jgi:hypothetical protein